MKGFFIKALILVWSKLFSTDPDMKAFFFTSTYSVAVKPHILFLQSDAAPLVVEITSETGEDDPYFAVNHTE